MPFIKILFSDDETIGYSEEIEWRLIEQRDEIELQGPANINGQALYFWRWLNEHNIGSF